MTRRRWIQIEGSLVEVSADYLQAPEPTVHIHGDKAYENCRDTNGVDLSTRTKHQNYLKEKGLAMASDFKNEWQEAAKKRLAAKDSTRVHDIVRAVEVLEHKRR